MNLRSAFDPPVPSVVLAEGEFGKPGGKTANGVVMHSELFDARAVVDSTCDRPGAGDVLDYPGTATVPVVESLSDAEVAGVSTWDDPTDYDRPAANVYDEGGSDRLLAAVEEATDL